MFEDRKMRILRTAILCGTALTGLPVASAAQEQVVYFVGDGFFPYILYASPGDIVRIVNHDPETARVEFDRGVEFGPPNCNNPSQWDDGEPDCDAGVGNNDDEDDDDDEGDAAEVTLDADEDVRFQVLGTSKITLTGQRQNGSGFTDAEYRGEIVLDRGPDLGF